MSVAVARTWLHVRPRAAGAAFAGFVVLTAVVTGGFVANPSFVRLAFMACLGALVVGFGLRAPKPLLYGMVVWLAALGLTRRLLSSGFAAPGSMDPLLLVEPLMLGILLVAAADHGAFRSRTRLGTALIVFVGLIVLGALNPLQGSLFAGLSALIFFVPLSSFWIGRALSDQTLKRTLLVFALLAIPAALYGLLQISSGFPSWDQAWIDSSGYTALQVGSATRPFSSFSSAAEYATFLSLAIMIWLFLGRRALRPLALVTIALLAVSVFYQSSRGSVVAISVAVALAAGARRGFTLPVSVVAAAALLATIPMIVKHVAPTSYDGSAQSQLVQHQVQGLANPFDPKQSTATAHLSLMLGGTQSVLRQPLGHGISFITLAGSKFGASSASSEADPSNVALALGAPGLIAYLVLFVLALRTAYRLARRTRDPLALAALAILVVLFPQWLNGGEYAVAFLPWLVLGWVDARSARLDADEAEVDELSTTDTFAPTPRLAPVPRPRPLPRRPVPAAAPRLEPERWELWRLERAVRQHAELGTERMFALRYLLVVLRSYVTFDGRLPLEFDGLVREEFGALLEDE